MTHTPWTADGDDRDWDMPTCDGAAVCGSTAIYDATGEVVAFAVNVGWNDKDVERRDLIVKAVNAYDKLVEALRQIANISYANYGRQNEKLADIEPIARTALEGLE